ncbi:MAG TPA: hypothetical protein VFG68_05095 [Fimbriiglobus sp.]|nr:hypothetical protein [Fimbriiglobus sp.]
MFPLFGQDPVADIANDSGKKIVVAAVVTVVTSAASFVIGRYWGRYKASREWHRKEFLNRVIVSLNIFADGFLKIRTVMERSLEEVFLNQVAIDKVMASARRCTPDSPILPIAREDRWYLLNFVLNAVAEHFAAGQVKQDAGEKVTVVRYALFLTAELVGDERIRKVRAMLVKQEHLTNFPYPDTMPKLENAWHDDRIRTLRKAAELYAKEPDNFLTLEVCV